MHYQNCCFDNNNVTLWDSESLNNIILISYTPKSASVTKPEEIFVVSKVTPAFPVYLYETPERIITASF